MIRLALLIALALLVPSSAYAQTPDLTASTSVTDGPKPLEITAKQTLEWRRNDKQYIARGDVVVRQDGMELSADLLTADYRDAKGAGAGDIYRMTATGHVAISANGSKAYGDKAVYEVDKSLATMTGSALRIEDQGQSVTARDRFEYQVQQGRLSAVGSARAVRGTDTIEADRLSAIFSEGPQSRRELRRMEADGHVVITTPDEVLKGDKGDYTKATNIATLNGHVSIKRGLNILEGDSADINMTTNVSRMQGAKGPSGRVRGVFYPNSAKEGSVLDTEKGGVR